MSLFGANKAARQLKHFSEKGSNFFIFHDYVTAHDVIGHDDIDHPVAWTDNSESKILSLPLNFSKA